VQEGAPAPAASPPEAAEPARSNNESSQTVCEALPDLAFAESEKPSSDQPAEEELAAVSTAASTISVGPQSFYRADFGAAAVVASAGLEAIDQAVSELVDELNDMGEQFADLLSTDRTSPMTAAVAGVAIAGVVELRFRRKRPAPRKQGDWIWLFSDLLGDAPGDGS
jgi:hypothetical protein